MPESDLEKLLAPGALAQMRVIYAHRDEIRVQWRDRIRQAQQRVDEAESALYKAQIGTNKAELKHAEKGLRNALRDRGALLDAIQPERVKLTIMCEIVNAIDETHDKPKQ